MTEPERRIARLLLDRARRAVLRTQPVYEPTLENGVLVCAYCHQPFDPTPSQRAKQRFCNPTHKANFWRREARRRERELRDSLRTDSLL